MNKNIIIITLIVALTVVASIYFWSSNNRYYMVTNKDGHVYQLDKTTGDTFLIIQNKKIPVKNITSPGVFKQL